MKHSYGFTFIEFSVVLAIFGILGLIAYPQYSGYRERAYSNVAISDLRNVAAAQEFFFADHQTYKQVDGCAAVEAGAKCAVTGLPGVTNLSKGISLRMTTTPTGFIAVARHVKASKSCTWDSSKGGLIGCS
jgi:prepilin-type N-terminal cleavage/methylation domain-containing protein